MTGLFEVLASDTSQQELVIKRAKLAVAQRVTDRFEKFMKSSTAIDQSLGEWNSRRAVIDDDLRSVVSDVSEEYGGNAEDLYSYVSAYVIAPWSSDVYAEGRRLAAGHPSGCDCGFCKNKGKLPGMKDKNDAGNDEDDDPAVELDEEPADGFDDKDSTTKRSFDYPSGGKIDGAQADPSGPGGPIGEELSDKSKGDNDEELGGPIGENASGKKGASVKRSSMNKRADGFAQCDCDCEGCDSGTHCESNNCIQTKRSGPKGLKQQASYDWDRVAADVETGDTYTQETVKLPKADNSGLGSEGSPKIDKGKVPKDGLKAIDVPSKQHPLEQQDLGSDTPDYWTVLPGPSDTGKSIDADSPLQPEHNVAPNTDTWSGSEGQANPVTSSSKWVVLK